jgi:hypothetical protein
LEGRSPCGLVSNIVSGIVGRVALMVVGGVGVAGEGWGRGEVVPGEALFGRRAVRPAAASFRAPAAGNALYG